MLFLWRVADVVMEGWCCTSGVYVVLIGVFVVLVEGCWCRNRGFARTAVKESRHLSESLVSL